MVTAADVELFSQELSDLVQVGSQPREKGVRVTGN